MLLIAPERYVPSEVVPRALQVEMNESCAETLTVCIILTRFCDMIRCRPKGRKTGALGKGITRFPCLKPAPWTISTWKQPSTQLRDQHGGEQSKTRNCKLVALTPGVVHANPIDGD